MANWITILAQLMLHSGGEMPDAIRCRMGLSGAKSVRAKRVFATYCGVVLLLAACIAPLRPPPEFAVSPTAPDIQIDLVATARSAIFGIRDPSGIGGMEAGLVSGQMPAKLEFHLHLTGLEELQFSYGDTTVTASVASTGEHRVYQTVATPDGTKMVEPDDPDWMTIELVTDDGSPGSIPLTSGIFSVTAPPAFHESGATHFGLRWIDFYR
ncbi:MAG: hypothetical protein HC802_04045 [Caldilineaceae bacterium]|nr:hypothetical protein [Caldilineaceae bacterium]